MKKTFILAIAAMAAAVSASAQRAATPAPQLPELTFTTVKANPITSIKNQNSSGTCWCFSAISFLESEAIRLNNIKNEADYPDFSEMFVVSHSYQDRAVKFIRMDGKLGFGAGSWCEDVVHHVMKDYGLVPNSVQPGLNYGTELPVHGELDALTSAYVQAMLKNPNKGYSTAWQKGFKAVVDTYLGECPTEFEYNGKTYTPQSYRDSYKLDSDNYVTLTSFTHHPFYEKFSIEVADNWRFDEAYNVPLDEFMGALKYALENGFTATWGGDVSEAGFNRQGLALLIDTKAQAPGTDLERFLGKTPEEIAEAKKHEAPVELEVTQESRQHGFDFKTTTDDHGMHAFGLAKDQYGNDYLMIKNSWGKAGKYEGIWYMSFNFHKAKCLDFMVHKDALPKDLKKKLGIN